jgi:hypothetical protein
VKGNIMDAKEEQVLDEFVGSLSQIQRSIVAFFVHLPRDFAPLKSPELDVFS